MMFDAVLHDEVLSCRRTFRNTDKPNSKYILFKNKFYKNIQAQNRWNLRII